MFCKIASGVYHLGMTDASYIAIPRIARRRPAPSVPLPKPQSFGAPVLITDCVTPLSGETVLSLLMKRMMQAAPKEDDQLP